MEHPALFAKVTINMMAEMDVIDDDFDGVEKLYLAFMEKLEALAASNKQRDFDIVIEES